MKGNETLQFYKDKNVLYYAAIQFVIDAPKKTHKTISKDDTHEGWLLLKERKRAEHDHKKLEQKLAAKKPDHIGSKYCISFG